MAHYASRGQLHLSDTRDQAAEQAVQTWATLTDGHDIRDRRALHSAHRRLANQQGDRLRRGHTRPPRHRLVHRPRRPRHRRARLPAHHTPRSTNVQQPRADPIACTSRVARPRVGPRIPNPDRTQPLQPDTRNLPRHKPLRPTRSTTGAHTVSESPAEPIADPRIIRISFHPNLLRNFATRLASARGVS